MSRDSAARTAAGFDLLSPWYDALAWMLLGRGIPASQTRFLGRVMTRRRALIAGGGSGRFLMELLERGFAGRVVNLDVSAAMLDRSRRRIERSMPGLVGRVEFRQGDLRTLPADEGFDLICTHYVLDLFHGEEFERAVRRLDGALRQNGLWICSDFAEPRGGRVRRALQAALLRALYQFFGVVCAVRTRRLPPNRATFRALGYSEECYAPNRSDLLWSGVYRKVGDHGKQAVKF
jgi:ubiquinone/menaquinone biosynthesis C-methylase UbiE